MPKGRDEGAGRREGQEGQRGHGAQWVSLMVSGCLGLLKQGVQKLVGPVGMGDPVLQVQRCSGPLRMKERIAATQRPLLPSPESNGLAEN